MDEAAKVLETYARRHHLTQSQRDLLRHATSGLANAQLAFAMNVKLVELALLEKLFHARTGRTLSTAVEEIRGIVRSRSSRPTARERRNGPGC